MSQVTTGIRALLSNPFMYEAFQSIMGAHKFRCEFVEKYIAPYTVENILDIGCGPASMLAYLPEANYYGFDISESYIDKAREIYGDKGNFFAKELTREDIDKLPKFDVVLMSGVLHHMDDEVAFQVIKLAHMALKPEGRLVTVDPSFSKGQSLISRVLVSNDRGQNVRNDEEYLHLASKVFAKVNGHVRHKLWIPYTHYFMECMK